MKSYTSRASGPVGFAREAVSLIRAYRRDVAEDVTDIVGKLEEAERLIGERFGLRIEGLSMLDVGAGQRLLQMTYFAAKGNDVVGVDRDVIVQGWSPAGFLRILRQNGPKRLAKTLGRKFLGIDRRYARELRSRVGGDRRGRLTVLQMDAGDLRFPDGTFDIVYSLAVFMHIERPDEAVSEVARVLRPGGVAYVDLMPFTSHIGALDIREIAGLETGLPLWAHLRPDHRDGLRESAYLNRLGLRDWERLFAERMPGCEFVYVRPEAAVLEPQARQLQEAGELREYDLDELVTGRLTVLWRKPS